MKGMSTMIKIRIRNDDHEIDLQFPISENKLYAKLAEIHAIEGKDAPQSAFVTEVYWPEELSMLKDRFANLDELNYLARRMESFDYAEINDGNTLVIMSHYPIMFYKNQHYGSVMLYGHVHNTREWQLVEKWKHEQWDMGIPSRLINVGCMMDYMRYTPRTLEELLDANPMPIFDRIRQDGTPVDSPSEDSCNG